MLRERTINCIENWNGATDKERQHFLEDIRSTIPNLSEKCTFGYSNKQHVGKTCTEIGEEFHTKSPRIVYDVDIVRDGVTHKGLVVEVLDNSWFINLLFDPILISELSTE